MKQKQYYNKFNEDFKMVLTKKTQKKKAIRDLRTQEGQCRVWGSAFRKRVCLLILAVAPDSWEDFHKPLLNE